jgi:CheY-like chemotaxis protein
MHGREILERIKSSPHFQKIPVAILTTSSAKEDIQFCLKAGANKFMTKPSTVEGFNETINIILDVVAQNQEK